MSENVTLTPEQFARAEEIGKHVADDLIERCSVGSIPAAAVALLLRSTAIAVVSLVAHDQWRDEDLRDDIKIQRLQTGIKGAMRALGEEIATAERVFTLGIRTGRLKDEPKEAVQ